MALANRPTLIATQPTTAGMDVTIQAAL